MMKRLIHTCILVFGAVCTVHAQSDPLFFQQSANRMLVNPAATGKGGDINTALTVRQHWVGFPGPTTAALYTNGFVKEIRSGIGLMWIKDQFGPQQTNNLKLNYAYYVPFEDVAFLSLGLGLGVMNNTYDETGFNTSLNDSKYRNDPYIVDPSLLDLTKQTKTIPDFNFGLEFNTPTLEVGFSVSHITYTYPDQSLVQPMRNFFTYSRYKIPMNRYWDFIPGFTWHNTRKVNTCELSATFRYENNIVMTLAYRNPMNYGMMFGVNFTNAFRIVYSYDYGFDNLSKYNNGSHEITLLHNVPVNTTYIRTVLRFFRWKMF